MTKRRAEELDNKTYFRTERMILESGQWFFSTREGTIHGPYADRNDAERELEQYIRMMRAQQSGELALTPRAPAISFS